MEEPKCDYINECHEPAKSIWRFQHECGRDRVLYVCERHQKRLQRVIDQGGGGKCKTCWKELKYEKAYTYLGAAR